jgi:hypothetical protein
MEILVLEISNNLFRKTRLSYFPSVQYLSLLEGIQGRFLKHDKLKQHRHEESTIN